MWDTVPSLLLGWGPVSLASIFEPIGNLGQRQSSFFGQCTFFIGSRVSILSVAIFQSCARFLFETVNRFLAIPNGFRERIFTSQSVLVHSSQRPVSHLFSFLHFPNKPKKKNLVLNKKRRQFLKSDICFKNKIRGSESGGVLFFKRERGGSTKVKCH